MTDAQTLSVYDAKIEDYKALTAAKPGRALIQFIQALPKGGTALDMGCGPAFAAAEMARHSLQVTATDASPEMAKAAGEHDGVTARCEDFSALPQVPTYDGIYANFCLLHVPKAQGVQVIRDMAASLNPGGYVHIGLKVGDGESRDALGRFYAYYQVDELRDLLTGAGLTVVWTKEGVEAGMAGTVDPFVLMQARA